MEVVHGAPKAAKSVSQDFISSMPDNVITNIMNRLPIKDALKTGILSKNWSYQYWNMVTEVVLDSKFCRYLYEGDEDYNGWILNRLLINLKGPITKFVLDIHLNKLPVEEISQWVLFLSRKGIKDLTLIMHGGRPLTLPRHLYSCMELKHLELYNCCFSPLPWFPGFPNLLSLDLSRVKFQIFTVAEFIARCPLLEILKIRDYGRTTSEEIFIEVAKHGNLRILSLHLDSFRVTSFSIHQLFFLPNLQELYLNFNRCKLLAADDAGKKVPNGFLSLKTLKLSYVDFSDNTLVPLIVEMIYGSPNLQTLEIRSDSNAPYPELCFLDLDYNTMELLHLQSVVLSCYRGSDNEVCLIKSILACSPQLKNILIEVDQYYVAERVNNGWEMARKLLNLNQAYPLVQIELH